MGNFFNLHPSILPEYRGPSPIFWSLREGKKKFGASIHTVTENLDEGRVVASSRFELNNPFSTNIVSKIYDLAGDLLVQWIRGESGIVDNSRVNTSYFSFPSEDDFIVDIEWHMEHIIMFVNAIKFFGSPKIKFPEGETKSIDSIHVLSLSQSSENSVLKIIDRRNVIIIKKEGVLLIKLTENL